VYVSVVLIIGLPIASAPVLSCYNMEKTTFLFYFTQ